MAMPFVNPNDGDNNPPLLPDDDLPEQNRLFSQSRALNALNWLAFSALNLTDKAGSNTPMTAQDSDRNNLSPRPDFDKNTVISSSREYNEEATIAFNRAHFHRQIYDALSGNPLSTLYSLAWSLCLHIEGRPAGNDQHDQTVLDWISDDNAPFPGDAEYIRIWFPFILLHRMTTQFMRLLAKGTEGNKDGADSQDSERHLFSCNDIRASDHRFRQSVRSVIQANGKHTTPSSPSADDIAARRARYRAKREAYLLSALFDRQCRRTPYGLSEIRYTDNQYKMVFIPRLCHLTDKHKILYNFQRYQAYEPLRCHIERKLQALFPHYHAKHGVHLDSWLFGSVCINEATATPESNTRSYLMYWQLQKSTLLWILMHALFAFNAMLNDLMIDDLLWFVAHDLEHFIECLQCHSHWTGINGGQFEWRQHEENFARHHTSRRDYTDTIQNKTLAMTETLRNNFDLALFRTQNNIQIQRINPARGLTEAALHALRRDYGHFAAALIGCLVEDSHGRRAITNADIPNENPNVIPFRCSIYDIEQQRQDVCYTPESLYLTALLSDVNDIMHMAQDERTGLACTLALERKRIDQQLGRALF